MEIKNNLWHIWSQMQVIKVFAKKSVVVFKESDMRQINSFCKEISWKVTYDGD